MDKKVINLSTLTSIANAIRKNEGTSDSILVSDFASRISALNSGSSSGKTRVTDSGDITFDVTSQTETFEHDLGVVPQFVRVWTDTDNYAYNRNVSQIQINGIDGVTDCVGNSQIALHTYCGNSADVTRISQVVTTYQEMTDTEVTLKGNSSGRTFASGIVYHYIMWADIEE